MRDNYKWAPLELTLRGIDQAIDNIAFIQKQYGRSDKYEEMIQSLRGVRLPIKEELSRVWKEVLEDKKK